MNTVTYSDLIQELHTFGTSRQEIAEKLRRAGFSSTINQSTLAKWSKETNPKPRMRQTVELALNALRKSAPTEEKFIAVQKCAYYIALLQTAGIQAELKDFDLFDVMQEVCRLKPSSFTLSDLLGLLELSLLHRIIPNIETIPKLLRLLKTR